MHDPWMDRLSEYLDGTLEAADVRSLELHLDECEACSVTLRELRIVVDRAHTVEDSPPERDLWSGIAAQLVAPADREPVVPVLRIAGAPTGAAALRAPRRFSFTMPELAAAAVLLISLSTSAVWWLGQRTAGPEPMMGAIAHTSGGEGGNGQLVAIAPPENRFDADIAELERTLDDAREVLDPATVEVIERSLDVIDQAIDDARTALAADPGNPHLTRQLDNTMRRKLEILRRAHRVQRVGA
jgi:hypothetical protein